MYKIYTEKGFLLNSTDFKGLVQALKFMVWTCGDIRNILASLKRSHTVIVIDKFNNGWRIDYAETL